jgi:hypothetical protein
MRCYPAGHQPGRYEDEEPVCSHCQHPACCIPLCVLLWCSGAQRASCSSPSRGLASLFQLCKIARHLEASRQWHGVAEVGFADRSNGMLESGIAGVSQTTDRYLQIPGR